MENDIAARFASDTKLHELTVHRDDGVFRHLVLQRPGTGVDRFELVTWPGCLCFTGDRGSYVFRRLRDMFEFFRGHGPNPQYWSEKCEAADRSDGIERFSPDAFREVIKERAAAYLQDSAMAPAERSAFDAEIEEILRAADNGSHEALSAAAEFYWDGTQPFSELWEYRVTEYTHRFLWCCHAIPWAIAKYDQGRKP